MLLEGSYNYQKDAKLSLLGDYYLTGEGSVGDPTRGLLLTNTLPLTSILSPPSGLYTLLKLT